MDRAFPILLCTLAYIFVLLPCRRSVPTPEANFSMLLDYSSISFCCFTMQKARVDNGARAGGGGAAAAVDEDEVSADGTNAQCRCCHESPIDNLKRWHARSNQSFSSLCACRRQLYLRWTCLNLMPCGTLCGPGRVCMTSCFLLLQFLQLSQNSFTLTSSKQLMMHVIMMILLSKYSCDSRIHIFCLPANLQVGNGSHRPTCGSLRT